MQNSIIFLSICLLVAACGTTSNSSSNSTPNSNNNNDNQACNTSAIVKDMTGMDGCKFLLELGNGDLLLPVRSVDMDFRFQNNQLVEFGYQEVTDQMSVCMAESKMVAITCIKLVGQTGGVRPGIPEKKPCDKINAPYDVQWMKDITTRLKPTKIDRYTYLDGWAYHFQKDQTEYIYDCQGTELCAGQISDTSTKCKRYLEQMGDKFTIWVVNN